MIPKEIRHGKRGMTGMHMLGRKLSPQTILKMKNRKWSPEARRKLSLARMGHPGYNKGEKDPRWKGGYQNKLMLNRKRRIVKIGNGGSYTLGDWETLKAQHNWTCPWCRRQEPEIKLTEDHIIPLFKGGSDNIENIQPLCKSCNSKKGITVVSYL